MSIAQAKRKPTEPVKVTLKEVLFYDKAGNQFKDEHKVDEKGRIVSTIDHTRYAKLEVYSDSSKKCFIKQYSGGRHGEVVVDPYGLLSNSRDLAGYNDQYGERFAEYRVVNADVFDTYVYYLVKRNPINFRSVERRILNGEAN